jgi:hypothetical protein
MTAGPFENASYGKALKSDFPRFHDPSAADLKIVALDYILLADYPDGDKWLTKMLERAPRNRAAAVARA